MIPWPYVVGASVISFYLGFLTCALMVASKENTKSEVDHESQDH